MKKFFIVQNSGITSGFKDTKILGKTAEEILMTEFNDAEIIKIDDIEKICDKSSDNVLLFPSFPFTKQTDIFKAIEHMEKTGLASVKFCGGKIIRKNGRMRDAVNISIYCGQKFIDMLDFPLAVEYARNFILQRHLNNGVFIEDINNTCIDFDVKIAKNAKINRFCVLKGNTEIGENTLIFASDINDSKLGENIICNSSTLIGATVGDKTTIGPYAYLRQNCVIGENCRIGDFVEIKNSSIGGGSKVSHLAYVGDATIGEKVNVGCGVVFVNYDGKNKNRTTVGDGSFLGSNCNFVAPLSIGKNVFVAAGSTVTKNLLDNDFCIAREREYIKHDWKRS